MCSYPTIKPTGPDHARFLLSFKYRFNISMPLNSIGYIAYRQKDNKKQQQPIHSLLVNLVSISVLKSLKIYGQCVGLGKR